MTMFMVAIYLGKDADRFWTYLNELKKHSKTNILDICFTLQKLTLALKQIT